MKLGADGFRLDVADELPDEFIHLLHKRVKELNPNGLVIGEVWEDASNKVSYSVRRRYFTNLELDATMNYPYKDAIIGFVKGEMDAGAMARSMMTIAENYPKPILDCVMNSLSTHDTMRILTVLVQTDLIIPGTKKPGLKSHPTCTAPPSNGPGCCLFTVYAPRHRMYLLWGRSRVGRIRRSL